MRADRPGAHMRVPSEALERVSSRKPARSRDTGSLRAVSLLGRTNAFVSAIDASARAKLVQSRAAVMNTRAILPLPSSKSRISLALFRDCVGLSPQKAKNC